MEQVLNQLVEKLRKAHGERLVSVVLYGSGAVGEHDAKYSDWNVLCVLSEITARELSASEEIFRWWRERGSPSPLLLMEREMAESTGCFAIEFHDIQRHHVLLYGKDTVAPLVVDDSSYRAEVAHDLRAKLLRLRQKAAGMYSDADLLRRLLLDSISTFCVLFRHALILHGAEAPFKKREVIAAARERFGIDPLPFDRLLDVREGLLKPRQVEPAALVGAYLRGITTVIEAVDRLEKTGDGR
jgi:hypothetical protein